MEKIELKDNNDLRTALALITENVAGMCNVNTTEDVIDRFLVAKDLLVEVYKFNVARVSHNKK